MKFSTLLALSLGALLFLISSKSYSQSGCTDELACNFDSSAVTDDGSCFYNGWYIPVTVDAGPAIQACEAPPGYIVPNQTAVEAVITVDPFCASTSWDQLCQDEYEFELGCTPELFIPVGTNIGPIQYVCEAPDGYVLADPCVIDVIESDGFCADGNWDFLCLENYSNCLGCTPQIYLPDLVASFLPAYFGCTPPAGYSLAESQSCAATVIQDDPFCLEGEWDSICENTYNICAFGCTVPGCADIAACNYDPDAECNDGSCDFSEQYYWIPLEIGSGPVLISCNQPEGYIVANQQCIEIIIAADPFCLSNSYDDICAGQYFICMTGGASGCTYENADNYNPDAAVDDGSCIFEPVVACPGDFNSDSVINTADLSFFLTVYGTTCL